MVTRPTCRGGGPRSGPRSSLVAGADRLRPGGPLIIQAVAHTRVGPLARASSVCPVLDRADPSRRPCPFGSHAAHDPGPDSLSRHDTAPLPARPLEMRWIFLLHCFPLAVGPRPANCPAHSRPHCLRTVLVVSGCCLGLVCTVCASTSCTCESPLQWVSEVVPGDDFR